MNKILCLLLALVGLAFAPVTANASLPAEPPRRQVMTSLPAVGTWVWASNTWWHVSNRWWSSGQYTWGGWLYRDFNIVYRRINDGRVVVLWLTYGRR
jgi:hypothetical protein